MNERSVIRLRRPAVLSVAGDPWQPDSHLRRAAEDRWAAFQASNSRAFDGRLVHVVGVHRNGAGGATIQAFPCAYRWYAAQVASGGEDIGCRPLGVKGITRCRGRVLVGRRAAWTACDGGLFELAPSGGVEPGRTPEEAMAREFAEEVGYLCPPPRPVAMLFDSHAMTWEVVYHIDVESEDVMPPNDEYEDIHWVSPDAIPSESTPLSKRLVGLGLAC